MPEQPRSTAWRDPDTGRLYDPATMAELPTAGADLGEKPRTIDPSTPGITGADANSFAALLGIEPDAEPTEGN